MNRHGYRNPENFAIALREKLVHFKENYPIIQKCTMIMTYI